MKFKLPSQLKDVIDKVLEKTRGIDGVAELEEHVLKRIDPNIVDIAGL